MKNLGRLLILSGILTLVGCAPAAPEASETTELSSSVPLEFHILSTCAGSATDLTIGVETNAVIAPASMTFLDFGFPAASIILGKHDPLTGMVSGIERTCVYPRATEGVHTHHVNPSMTYSCSENGIQVCQIQVALVVNGEHEH